MAVTGPALISKAFEELKATVSVKDAKSFQDTTLEQVWELAREIESKQSARLCNRNFRRLEPILRSLENYAPAIDAISQGFQPMAWVWVCALLNSFI